MKVAVIIENKFEDAEYVEPLKAFKKEGHEVINIGRETGDTVVGKKKGTEVKIDKSVGNADVNDFDALLIPGGYSPDKLRAYEEPVDFTRKFAEAGKPIFAICHGAQLLITADVLEGRTMTGYKSIKQDLINAGVNYKDKEVVVDDNIVSSRNPNDLPAFIKESLKKLR